MENVEPQKKKSSNIFLRLILGLIFGCILLCIIVNIPEIITSINMRDMPIPSDHVNSESFKLIKEFNGGFQGGVASRDNLLFLGMGSKIVIYELTTAGKLNFIGQTENLPELVTNITLVGNFAIVYASGTPKGYGKYAIDLFIVDISQIDQPKYIRSLEIDGDYVSGISSWNDSLFISNALNLTRIEFIKNDIQIKKTYPNLNNQEIVTWKNYLIFGNQTGDIRIYDVQDKDQFEVITVIHIGNRIEKMVVAGEKIYTFTNNYFTDLPPDQVYITDLLNNFETKAMKGFNLSVNNISYINSKYLFFEESVSNETRTNFLDINQPDSIKSLVNSYAAKPIFIKDNLMVLVSDYCSDLLVLDISDINKPHVLSDYKTVGGSPAFIKNNFLLFSPYSFLSKNTISYINLISDEPRPDRIDLPINSWVVGFKGTEDTIISYGEELILLDVSDPDQIRIKYQKKFPISIINLIINNDLVYFIDQDSILYSFNIHHPENIKQILPNNSGISPHGYCADYLGIIDHYLLIGCHELFVFDLFTPEDPYLIREFHDYNESHNYYFTDHLGFIRKTHYDIRGKISEEYSTIVELKNPEYPKVLYKIDERFDQILDAGNQKVIFNSSGSLKLFDFSNNGEPEYISGYEMPKSIEWDVTLINDTIVASSGDQGTILLKYTP